MTLMIGLITSKAFGKQMAAVRQLDQPQHWTDQGSLGWLWAPSHRLLGHFRRQTALAFGPQAVDEV